MSAATVAIAAKAAASARTRIGVVVSAGLMPKTVKVRVPSPVWNSQVRKYFHHHKDYISHDENNACVAGDVVRITPINRASKTKQQMVCEVITPFGTGIRTPVETFEEMVARVEARRTERQTRRQNEAQAREKAAGSPSKADKAADKVASS